jgi:hypothetical protein
VQRDRAAVTICSTVFLALGRAQARALNHPDLPIVTVPHPFGSRSRAEIRGLAEQCLADVVATLAAP